MDKQKALTVGNELREKIQLIANRHGMVARIGTIRFSDHELRVTIEAREATAPNKEADAFTRLAEVMGMKPSDLGRKAVSDGQTYTVIGLKRNARRLPIMLRLDSDGSVHRCGPEAAILMIEAATKRGLNA